MHTNHLYKKDYKIMQFWGQLISHMLTSATVRSSSHWHSSSNTWSDTVSNLKDGVTFSHVWTVLASLVRGQSHTPLSARARMTRERETSKIFISFSKRSELNMACFNCKHLLQVLMETTVSVVDGAAHGWRDSTGNEPHPCVVSLSPRSQCFTLYYLCFLKKH